MFLSTLKNPSCLRKKKKNAVWTCILSKTCYLVYSDHDNNGNKHFDLQNKIVQYIFLYSLKQSFT